MNLSKVANALVLCVALTGTLAAAPQAPKATTPAKSTDTTTQAAPKTAMKGDMVAAADLPKAVTDAVTKAHPKGTVASASKMMRGTVTVYAVKVTDAGKTVTMNVNEDGTMAAAKGKGKAKQ